MKNKVGCLTMAVLMPVLLCGCGKSLMNAERESQAIWEIRLAVQKALCTEDTDAMMRLWAEDGTFAQPDGSLWIGKDKIREAHDILFEASDDFKIEFERMAINFPTPDVAVEEASYVFSSAGFQSKGRDTTVLVKRDGRWLIAAVSDFVPQTPAGGTAEQTDTRKQDDIRAIRTLFDDFCEAHKCNDGAKLAEFYTDDAMLMPSDEPTVSGTKAIASRYQEDLDRFSVELITLPDEIDVSGNLGFARGTFTIKLTPKGGGEKIEVKFKAISILRKGTGGSWRLYCDIWNSDAPLPPRPKDLTVAPSPQSELIPMDNPTKTPEGLYQVGWVEAWLDEYPRLED